MKQSLSCSEPTSLMRNRAYLALMAAQLISNLGDWLYLLALLTMIGFKWSATPWQITITMLCILLPILIGGPFAGMLADRMERRKLMIISDVARFFIVFSLVFVTALWQVYLILIIKGIFDVMFSPAKSGKIKEIVPPEQMEQAVAYSSIIEQGSKIIGPALGGILTAAFGVSACFIIDASSFLLSAVILLAVPIKRISVKDDDVNIHLNANVANSEENKLGFWGELASGLRLIVSIPLIAFGLLTLSMALLVLQIADSQTVVLFREIPGMSEDVFGWCIALSGVGTLLAAGLIQLLRAWSPLTKMGVGGAVLGIVFAFAGYVTIHLTNSNWVFILVMVLFLLAGLGAGMTLIPFNIALQQKTPEHMIGRVFGTVTSITSAASVLGPVLGGALVTAFGPAPAFMLSGGLMVLIGLLVLVLRPIIMKNEPRAELGIEG